MGGTLRVNMKRIISITVIVIILVMQWTWAFNYCHTCTSKALLNITKDSCELHSCCSVRPVQPVETTCDSCGDNCKCNSLQTEDRYSHTIVDFDFAYTVEHYVPLYVDFSMDSMRFNKIQSESQILIDPSPPPIWGTVVFPSDILRI